MGGNGYEGTVFELSPNAAKTAWTETVLYSFWTQANCTDGAFPESGVVRAPSGNLYWHDHRGRPKQRDRHLRQRRGVRAGKVKLP